jgi:hypothetical protein
MFSINDKTQANSRNKCMFDKGAQVCLPQNQENLKKHNAYLMQLINMK